MGGAEEGEGERNRMEWGGGEEEGEGEGAEDKGEVEGVEVMEEEK